MGLAGDGHPHGGHLPLRLRRRSHDATCGLAAGASLQIDNVRVYGTKATDDVTQQVARLLAYSNTSDTPPASRTITILADSNRRAPDPARSR